MDLPPYSRLNSRVSGSTTLGPDEAQDGRGDTSDAAEEQESDIGFGGVAATVDDLDRVVNVYDATDEVIALAGTPAVEQRAGGLAVSVLVAGPAVDAFELDCEGLDAVSSRPREELPWE